MVIGCRLQLALAVVGVSCFCNNFTSAWVWKARTCYDRMASVMNVTEGNYGCMGTGSKYI